MLPTSFVDLAFDRPELRGSLVAIEHWCKKHAVLPVIDPRRLAVEEPSVSELDLSSALDFLVAKGVLEQVYRFETDGKYLLANDYRSYRDVPEILIDRDERRVSRKDGEIVPVFRGLK